MRFTHLNLHTEFSLVDGIIRINPLFDQLNEEGVTAVALTDLGNAFGAIKFYKSALKHKIKPIFGAECLLITDDNVVGKVTLLAKNYDGYLNLSKLISEGYLHKQIRGIPHITPEWLNEYHHNLIIIISQESHFGQILLNQGEAEAKIALNGLYRHFLDDRLYIGIKRLQQENDEHFIALAAPFAQRENLPLVALNDVRFMKRSDFEVHELRTCIQSGHVISDRNRPKLYSEEQYLKSADEMIDLFKDFPEAIENSNEIAKRCTVILKLGQPQLPHIQPPDGMSVEDYFTNEAKIGLTARIGEKNEMTNLYWERLEREIGVILSMGFPDYFLIVADFIQWSKDNEIPVGPGRGSGAGSLVAWALNITDIDPIPYDLLFERFLNPERISMPDFDVDFCMEGRDRVIDYVANKYGRDAVSQIATHGTMAAKGVIRDVGRALGHPYGFVDSIARLVPFEIGITLEKAMMQEPDLHDLYHQDEEVKALMDYATQLEGLTKSVGRHAGGVVISPTVLTDFSPLYCEEGSTSLVTQYDKDDIEAAGLVKFDFLGLRTLTIIDWALKNIKITHDRTIVMHDIPLDDSATFDLLKACQTTAVFQLESRGMKDLLRRMQPDTFEDIIALVALFRPGPLESGMVEDFINRKHGLADVDYPFPELEPVLAPTYGVIVYQEQVMQISQIIGNYTLGGADLLRRAMGAKLPEVMAEQRALFMQGAAELGFDADKAGRLFDLMEKFAGYGFNKSHSAAYALLSYHTAYLKHHYPAEFMAAVLSSDLDHTEKLVVFIEECKAMKLIVRRPCINESFYMFTVNNQGHVVYGLGGIRGYGKAAALQLAEERENSGPYLNLFDFCRRIDLSKTTRRAIEILIRAGALDSLEERLESVDDRCRYRASLLATLPEAINLANQHHQNEASGQNDLFGLFDDQESNDDNSSLHHKLAAATPMTEFELLQEEKSTLGFYFTAHPIDQYQAEIDQIITHSLAAVGAQSKPEFQQFSNEPNVLIAGLVTQVRTMYSKAGNKMIFVTLEDRMREMEIRIFDEHLEALGEQIENDSILFISGSFNWDNFNEEMRIRASELFTFEMIRRNRTKCLYITNQKPIELDDIEKLTLLLQEFHDESGKPIAYRYNRNDCSVILQIKEKLTITPSDDLLNQINQTGTFRAQYHY